MLVVESDQGYSVDQVLLIPVEIERSSHAAIHERRNGVQQLRKYEGHQRFLAIPETVARVPEARTIPDRCRASGFGLLVVDLAAGTVTCEVDPIPLESRSLRVYASAMKRWIALCNSGDTYRRISHGVIAERG
ncbi:MAG: hypothetical protein WBG19_05495 [Thermoplasmata archaeon]